MESDLWMHYVEFELVPNGKEEVGEGIQQLKPGSIFIPCGEYPSSFKILQIFNSKEEAYSFWETRYDN